MNIIENEHGDVWFVSNNKTILYIDRNGTLYAKGDVVGYSGDKIPPIPKNDENNQKRLTDYFATIKK